MHDLRGLIHTLQVHIELSVLGLPFGSFCDGSNAQGMVVQFLLAEGDYRQLDVGGVVACLHKLLQVLLVVPLLGRLEPLLGNLFCSDFQRSIQVWALAYFD